MRILHTSDWHLGKRLMERERLPEQAEVMEEIISICDEKRVELVLIAGDIFDTYLPPAEAEELFFATVKRLAAGRAVVIISGNHDDGVRLAASAPLAGEEGVYIFGGHNGVPTGGDRPVRVVDAGENFAIVENAAGERVYLNILPYPNEARLKELKTEETYAEKAARWIAAGDEKYDNSIPHILLTHLFVAGSEISSSERDISLGGARAVPKDRLPAFGYTALGHIHKQQKMGENARYSGAILQYSFDEANTEKCVLLLETKGTDVAFAEKILLKAGKRLVRLEANGAAAAVDLLKRYENCFIELTLHLTSPLTAGETEALRDANDGLVSLKTEVCSGETAPVESRAQLGAGELFTQYYRSMYAEDPSEELKETFLKLLGEEDA